MSHPEEKIYDLVVIGAGMFGSATAYHASEISSTAVCLVGPPEPTVRKGHDIFGCWFDEGRVYFRAYVDPTWRNLSTKSVERYSHLEKLTGVNFYTEIGFAFADLDKKTTEAIMEGSRKCGLGAEDVTNTWKTIFPFLHLPDEASVIWEKNHAGHISPRQLVAAFQSAAQVRGAAIVRKIVSTVLPSKSDTHKWDVVTECGSVLQAHCVVVAAGGFAALKPLFHHVVPRKVPNLELRTQTISYLRVGEEEVQRLKLMPPMVLEVPYGKIEHVYVLPPIKYPDGKWYLKLGHGRVYEERKTTLCEVREWYVQQSGNPECVDELAKYLCHILPGLKVEKVSGDGCLTSHTPSSLPYIDTVADGFGVALGGNGYGAKASYEIGRLAARLVLLGEWDSEIPKEDLKINWTPSEGGY